MADYSNIPVEVWEISKLAPYAKNNKKHPEAHIKALAASINEYGVEHPIAIEEDGTIISGHGRRLALLELGRTYAPVRVFRGITKEQANKLRIAANKTTSNEYDTDALAEELRNILESGLDLEGIGLTEKEATLLLEDIGELDMSAMSDDIAGDVERHEKNISKTAAAADEALIPLAKAFNIKIVEAPVARLIKQFLGVIEAQTGKKGIDALSNHMLAVVDGA